MTATNDHIRLFEVGGCVRDELLGLRSKDLDFSVEITGLPADLSKGRIPGHEITVETAFDAMRNYLTSGGFHIFVETPDKGCIRAHFPKGHPMERQTADFVLCRKDGPYSDGRRPDYVTVGTLKDDLDRRDFSVNAMARELFEDGTTGELIDYHDGMWDLGIKRLRFVGDPMDRIREDGIRILRAIRFKLTKGFEFDQGIRDVLADPEVDELLHGVSVERRREELEKCFHHDTIGTMMLLTHDLRPELLDVIFEGNLRLCATQKRDVMHR